MKSNRAPFTDVCVLIRKGQTLDADGYAAESDERSEVFCSISAGVNRKEMYEALKAGLQLSGTAEIWEDDYEGHYRLEHEGVLYNIVRVYPTGYGTLELSLQEVVH